MTHAIRGRAGWGLVVLAALALMVGAGCGGDDDESAAASETEMTMEMPATSAPATTAPAPATDGGGAAAPAGEATVIEIPAAEQGLAFATTEVRAPAGTITLRMPNPAAVDHNIAIDEPEQVIGEIVGQGGVSEVTADFEPGTYEYYCSVPGHRQAGMVGTLIVE